MKHAKTFANSSHWAGSLSSRTFGRAARLTTVLVGGGCSTLFVAMAVVFRDGSPLAVGLVLVPLMLLAIWIIAAVLGTMVLLPRWLWAKRMDLDLQSHTAGERSGVWDGWVDGPSRV